MKMGKGDNLPVGGVGEGADRISSDTDINDENKQEKTSEIRNE